VIVLSVRAGEWWACIEYARRKEGVSAISEKRQQHRYQDRRRASDKSRRLRRSEVSESVEKKREVGDAKIRFGKSFLSASCHVDGKASAYYVNKTKKIREFEFGKIRMIRIWRFCGCHRVAVNRC